MFTPRIGSFEGMKSLNKSAILNLIRLNGPISRAEIAKMAKLTPPTVGSIVNELIKEDLIIEEVGKSNEKGGRKPIMLSIHNSAFRVIGVYAAAEVVRAVAATLEGDVISEFEISVTSKPSKSEFLINVKSAVRNVIEDSKAGKDRIIGIGVAMHGIVDPKHGVSVFSPHLNLEDIHIADELKGEFNIPVIIENDVRALALAESWYGKGRDVSNFVCLSVGLGIGSGIIMNNEIYPGPVDTAGEIGHTIVDVNGPKCSCGNYGCLEAFSSESAIINQLTKAVRMGRQSIILEYLNDSEDDLITMDMIFRALEVNDPLVIETFENSGRFLGVAMANLINLLTPSKIILEGRIFNSGDTILEPLRRMVDTCTLRKSKEVGKIEISDLGKNGMVIGAYTLILKNLFTPTQLK